MNANSHGDDERVHRALGYAFRLTGALEPRLAPLFTSMIDRTPTAETKNEIIALYRAEVSPHVPGVAA